MFTGMPILEGRGGGGQDRSKKDHIIFERSLIGFQNGCLVLEKGLNNYLQNLFIELNT